MNNPTTVRAALGLSQTQFAAKLGVTVRTVSRWDTKASKPTPAVQRLIDAMAEKCKHHGGKQ